MKKNFDYYYFRLYKYYSNGDVIPQFSTLTTIFVFLFFNITSLMDLIFGVILGEKITLPTKQTHGYWWSLFLLLPHYLLFHYYLNVRGCHFRILEKFKNETPTEKRLSIIITILYFIFSIIFFVFTLYLRQLIRGY